ncbi:MAG: DUF5995 family protein [Bacteroidota bacterium]
MQAQTIDEVIQLLDEIIENAKKENNPAGYFAALYRKVTKRVKEGILNKEFEDGARMEKLDVLFANRYLEAHHTFFNGDVPTQSWQVAFHNTSRFWPIVLQHLLWGINAHINLDLGIAAAETVAGGSLEELKKDFDQINDLLAELVGEVQNELSQIWPVLKYILALSDSIDNFFINFSMERARDGAWKFANELHLAKQEDREQLILDRDTRIAEVAAYINPPGFIPRFIFGLIRLGERGTIKKRIKILE